MESIFIFSFVVMDWWQSQLGWVHIWGAGKENKMSKDECEFFTAKLRWIIWPSWWVAKSAEATILYNDSQHNIPAISLPPLTILLSGRGCAMIFKIVMAALRCPFTSNCFVSIHIIANNSQAPFPLDRFIRSIWDLCQGTLAVFPIAHC